MTGVQTCALPISVLAFGPLSVVLADGGAPAVLALTLASSMRAFLPWLRRPGPLLPSLRLWLLPSPPLPSCRFPLAPALSALAPLFAMPARALSPASAPTTAPSFSVSVLPLLRHHTRLCSQMEAPPPSLHLLLRRLCSQMEAPPQSLHSLLRRLCTQMQAPPQSLDRKSVV